MNSKLLHGLFFCSVVIFITGQILYGENYMIGYEYLKVLVEEMH